MQYANDNHVEKSAIYGRCLALVYPVRPEIPSDMLALIELMEYTLEQGHDIGPLLEVAMAGA